MASTEVSNPVRRIRWATKRVTGRQADNKRESILDRMHIGEKRRSKRTSGTGSDVDYVKGDEPSEEQDAPEASGRKIFFNIPLPDDARDKDGHPLSHYPRNKIRTAKYTPLSFIPKNLWFQFHNVANIYFLFIIILCFFSIFGASNPGLNAVPLIVILVVTAIKDGIEDWRRTVLDNELNNAPVHRLLHYDNPNTAEDRVSPWRKVKKGTSAGIRAIWRKWKHRKAPKQGKTYAERALDENRPSLSTHRASVISNVTHRTSFHSTRSHARFEEEGIQMQPVGAGDASDIDRKLEQAEYAAAELKHKTQGPSGHQKKFWGDVINPHRAPNDLTRFGKDYWKNVQVGDFIRLYDGEEVPADVIVLSTSDADGSCYIETKNLDGETNLKVRNALHCSRKIKHARQCEQAEFIIDSEAPHANLYAYNGVIKWQQRDRQDPDAAPLDMAEPVGINNLLLRGSSLRNTEWALGVVVFTGRETKIMLNSGITPSKRAKISRDLNWNVLYNFVILFIMCLVAGIVQGVTWGQSNTSHKLFEYKPYGDTPAMSGFITFWAAIILFQNLVPISLYISLEIIRTLQAFFIYSDVEMYYAPIDYPCTPKSWNISDDVGQIEYIFSDKTGTLTQNVMEFKKCTVNGETYGEAYTEALAGLQKRQGIDIEVEGEKARKQIAEDRVLMLERIRKMHDNPYLRDTSLTFVAPDYIADLDGAAGDAQKFANYHFMEVLALCHTVISERTGGDEPSIEFKAQSPDEAALVGTARDCGFTVLGRTDDSIILNILGEERVYTILNTLEFNSTRKRMSAIIRMPDGKIVLFCKGADSMIYSRLKSGDQRELRQTTAEHLEMFAREGLRTLCIAERELSEDEYRAWNEQYDVAAALLNDREEELERVSDTIERDLTLLGGTAIEDRLQDGVPEAIQLLGDAGIKLWVLTGDKVETAINIGFSCNLLDNDMDLIVLKIDDESVDSAEVELDKHLGTFNMTGSDEELKAAQHNHEAPDPTHAIVIDGDSLKLVLDDRLKQKFLLLCKQCRAVLCCRVSPAQKAAVVRMVKTGLDCLTLAIGDGANDVAMIQEAHVGVGIAGEEGRQAVMSSDYAIGQFRFLTRLVIVHGRWSYRRLAETIANFFYKNLVWTFAIFWYQIYDNFDCSYIYDYTYILLYNLAFTSLPVILMGVLDQDVDDKVALAVPQLYRRGIERKEWTQPKFWMYMFDGIYQSLMVWFMTYLLFSPANFNTSSGLDINDGKRIGVFVATAAVVVVNLYVLFNTYRWDWLMVLIVAISILLIWFWTGVYTAFTAGFTFYKAAPQVYGALTFWCNLLVVVILCLLPRFVIKAIQKVYFPRDVDIIREQVRLGKFDYLKEVHPTVGDVSDLDERKSSDNSSDASARKKRFSHLGTTDATDLSDDMRPIRAPNTATSVSHTHSPSEATQYTGHERDSTYTNDPSTVPELRQPPANFARPYVYDRPRPSFDRARMSMDRLRPSFEQSRDMTSAAGLMRVESSHSNLNREVLNSRGLETPDGQQPHGRFHWPRVSRRLSRASRMSRLSKETGLEDSPKKS